MARSKTFKAFVLFTLVACLSAVISCSSQFAASMRKVTYPPDFKYTENSELRSEMAKLALQMQLLDHALTMRAEENTIDKELQRKKVLAALKQINKVASALQSKNAGANHPFMQDYMQDFVSKVDQAQVAASLEPPRYYYAGKVSGACVSCHKINR